MEIDLHEDNLLQHHLLMKYVLVPISTVGCGKSTTFRIIKALHPNWAHIENDNCSSKNEFYTKIKLALRSTNVVLLDRNNHLLKHRQEICENLLGPDVRLVALVFVNSNIPKDKLRNVTYRRIMARGDNHQTIKSASNGGLTNMILGRFLKEFRPYDPANAGDSEFYPIEMTLQGKSSKENARRILKYLHGEIGVEVPSANVLEEEFEKALGYVVPETPNANGKREHASGGNENNRIGGANKRNGGMNKRNGGVNKRKGDNQKIKNETNEGNEEQRWG